VDVTGNERGVRLGSLLFQDGLRPPFLNLTLVPALFFIRKRMNPSRDSLNH